MFISIASLNAQLVDDNTLLPKDFQCGAGRQAILPVEILNNGQIVAIQFDLTLPAGFRVSDTTQIVVNRSNNHKANFRHTNFRTARVIVTSSDNSPISGNDGIVLEIPITTPDTATEGSKQLIMVEGVILSDTNGKNICTGFTESFVDIIHTPRPDITLKEILISPASFNPGDKVNISWQVCNDGDAPTESGFSEQVFLESQFGETVYLGTLYFNEILASGQCASRQAEFTVPKQPGTDGESQAMIKLITSRKLGELPINSDNNIGFSSGFSTLGSLLELKFNRLRIAENDLTYVQGQIFRSGSRLQNLELNISTNKPERVTIPALVTIPAGSSGTYFQIHTKDNEEMNLDSVILISAEGINYPATNNSFVIEDNEVPGLTVTVSKEVLNEGDTVTIRIERQILSSTPLLVSLKTDKPKRFKFSKEIEIPANEKVVQTQIVVVNDLIPEMTEDPYFIFNAQGYLQTKRIFSLLDNDVPEITMSISPETINESGGYQAAIATVKRYGITDNNLVIKLSDNSNGLLFYNTPTFTIEQGKSTAQFTIGVVDNLLVDGIKDVEIRASVHISSCNCTVGTNQLGTVSSHIQINDDDGPALKLTSSQSMLPEGRTDATILTLSRNTPPENELAVELFSNRDDALLYEHFHLIPPGISEIQIPVSVLANDSSEGDQMVSFSAFAADYANGFCWAMISDQTLADATIKLVKLSADTVVTKANIDAELIISNEGSAPLGYGKEIELFISKENNPASSNKTSIGNISLTKDIAPGKWETQLVSVQIPDLTGKYYIFAEINKNQAQKELSFLNNNSSTIPIQILPAFSLSLTTDRNSYSNIDTILFTGKANAYGSAGISNEKIEIYLFDRNGTRHSIEAQTDDNGVFSKKYLPGPGVLGHIIAGACYPAEKSNKALTEIDILGLQLMNSNYIIWEPLTGETVNGTIGIKNPCLQSLHNIDVQYGDLPEGLELTFQNIPEIAGGESADLQYTLKASSATLVNDYVKIKLTVKSEENSSFNFTAHYHASTPSASLKASIPSIRTTMTKGMIRSYDFTITNQGKGSTGEISISLPKTTWMSLLTPVKMPALASGESTVISLQFTPGNELALNTPVTGNFGINCQNGNGISMPFHIEPVSESTGNLKIDVCDEYTYYTEDAPHVANATVRVKHPYTKALVSEGKTDSTGIFYLEGLLEGYYYLEVTAEKHDGYANNILVDPGRTTLQVINLSFQAITYKWEVVETEVEDVYELETIVKFETNVPTPVVEMISPDEIDTESLSIGEKLVFNVILTNKGLITAKDVQVGLPQGLQTLKFEPLFNIFDLRPQESVMVPVTVTKLADPYGSPAADGMQKASQATTDNCKDYIVEIHYWDCGNDRKWHEYSKTINLGRWCTGTASTGGYGGGFTPLTFGGGSDYGNYTGTSNESTPEVSVSDCEPCQNRFTYKMAKCFVKNAPYIKEVISFVEDVQCLQEAWYIKLWCVVKKLPVINRIVEYKDFYEDCLKPVLEPCVPGDFAPVMPGLSPKALSDYPSFTLHFQEVLQHVYDMNNAYQDQLFVIFGDSIWLKATRPEVRRFFSNLELYGETIPDGARLVDSIPTNVTIEQYQHFVERWNNSGKGFTLENQIDLEEIERLNNIIQAAISYAKSLGYNSVEEMFDKEEEIYNQEANDNAGSVCATISLKFSQTMTMTRQAFRGTLTVFNGHESMPMKDIRLDLEVKDPNGEISGSHTFQINTENLDEITEIDGTGTLNSQKTGVATILFIPTKYAAPEVPVEYSFGGTLTYTDPFTNTEVTRTLYPVTMTVRPSPDLALHYFMQRDILGDDPLTLDKVEPSIDAEFSLMIHNQGKGDATKVKVSSKQPEIIDNEKGLLIQFEITGSSLNGSEKNLGITNIDFGNIPAGGCSYGQWWFYSSLLGHFIEYSTKVTHATSYDNPDLSLVKSIDIHELIRSIDIPREMNNLRGFLVNDVTDSYDLADMIYKSDGTVSEVNTTNFAQWTKIDELNYRLDIQVNKAGWNYSLIDDPGLGNLILRSVTRQSDGKNLPANNCWQTNVLLKDGKEPLYINQFHIVDSIAVTGGSYTCQFEAKRLNILNVSGFSGVPDTVAKQNINYIDVSFNRPIVDSTFSFVDLQLRSQGKIIDLSKASIDYVSGNTYRIDLSNVNTGQGYLVLTVNTNGIIDDEGYVGESGKSTSWIQFNEGKVEINIQVEPVGSGIVTPQSGQFEYGVMTKIKASSQSGYHFKQWLLDGQILGSSDTLAFVPNDNKTLIARFELNKYKVEVTGNIVRGVITGNNSGIYDHGSEIHLTALALKGYIFTGWRINGEFVETYDTSISFLIDSDFTIEAVFEESGIVVELGNSMIEKIKIYPNPATSGSIINIVGAKENQSVILYNYLGECVFRSMIESGSLQIPSLNPGVYLIIIRDNQLKLIIK